MPHIISRRSLHYRDGANDAADRPAFVRAASSCAWIGGDIAIIQDDANFVALVDVATASARAIELPRGHEGLRQFDDARGNKRFKLDLEACVSMRTDHGQLLLAIGSGSKKRRENIVLLDWGDQVSGGEPTITVVDASPLYERLRDKKSFAGSEMNIEGAVVVGDMLRLFGRANGEATAKRKPVSATCDLPLDELLEYLRNPDRTTPPKPRNIVQYELGMLDGVALGFTDAASIGESLVFTATAERSDNATVDGPVTGSVVGVIDINHGITLRPIVDANNSLFMQKVEGIVLVPQSQSQSQSRAFIVTDADNATMPSELCEIDLTDLPIK